MGSRNIPRDEWLTELDNFSRQHEGWIVRVRIKDQAGHERTEVVDLPLQGVSADSPRSRALDVIVGDNNQGHVTHEVDDPVTIAVETTDEGAERGLTIRSRDGSTVTVEFRTPMRPEDVDSWPRRS